VKECMDQIKELSPALLPPNPSIPKSVNLTRRSRPPVRGHSARRSAHLVFALRAGWMKVATAGRTVVKARAHRDPHTGGS
jgi:hypothetical protein